jgi:formylglycine-generating enzyme required for sulfatase activity
MKIRLILMILTTRTAVTMTVFLGLLITPSLAANLHKAVRANDVATVLSMLDPPDPAIVNATVADGVTPLHIAAALNNKTLVAILASSGADINAKTDSGFTPLHWAASRNAVDTIDLLITLGADMNSMTSQGITPLHWAAGKNADDAVRQLIVRGADIYSLTMKGYRPLHWAVLKNATNSYNLLVYKQVSDEDEAGLITDPEPLDQMPDEEPKEMEQPEDTPSEPAMIQQALRQFDPLPKKEEALSVSIGQEQQLHFTWVKALELWFGTFEVSNFQYQQYKPEHDSLFREGFALNGPNQPVVSVSWKQAHSFCSWMTKKYGHILPPDFVFRLPTNAEWITCAKSGQERIYPWGNDLPPTYGNFSDLTAKDNLSAWSGLNNYKDDYVVSCSIQESGLNEWGIYGMSGNVWEWCEDWFDSTRKTRIRQGGSWDFDGPEMLKIATYGFDTPNTRDDTVGFRAVAAPK